MDYLKALRDDPDLAEAFDSLFDFFLLDELSPRDEADGRATFTLPGMAFARDGSGGEYHLFCRNKDFNNENSYKSNYSYRL